VPRRRREWIPEIGAHSISRFVDRRFYLVDDVDRAAYLDAIGRADDRWDWRWISFAMMSSHVHHGHIAGAIDPDRFFRSAHTRYAQRFHRRYEPKTLGPVFADRPTIHPVERSRLLHMVAYHHRNTVEAGVVERPRDSTWTSHRMYLRLDPAPSWLDIERALDILGFRDTEAGRRRFDESVMDADLTDRSWEPEDLPRDPICRSGAPDLDWQQLIAHACDVVGLPAGVSVRSRAHDAALVRRLVAIIAITDLGQTHAAVGAELGMGATSVFNLVKRRTSRHDVDQLVEALRRRLIEAPIRQNDELDEEHPLLRRAV
jgi:REP element-mobilizing transposase RayT